MSSIYTANQIAVSELYIALLGRNPEPTGYAYWVNKLNGGETQLQAAAEMAYAPEFFSTYAALSTTEAIARIYTNVFERTADDGGLQYWSGRAQALIAAGTPTVVAYAQTASNMIVAGYTNNSTDTPLIQSRVNTATASGTAEPSVTHTLTTGIDIIEGTQASDIFNGSLGGAFGDLNTLNPLDSLNGFAGTDTLNVQLVDGTAVQPRSLANIETINLTVINTSASSATLDLLNAGQAQTVTNYGSTASEVTFLNIASGANLAVTNVDNVDTNFSYVAGNTVAADLTVTGVGTANATTITISNAGAAVNLISAGTLANSVILDTASNITAVTVAGAANLTLSAVDATTVNANQTGNVFSGNLTFTAGVAATVNGGSGNDALTGADNVVGNISGNDGNDSITAGGAGSLTHADSLNGGLGNDVITNADLVANTSTAASNDTIVGGGGVDTLVSGSAAFALVDNTAANAVQSISGIEAITVSDALGASLTLSKIQAGIQTVTLNALTGAARTVTFDSGVAATVNLNAAAAQQLTVAAAGTGTSDSLTIANTTAATDVFAGQAYVVSSYETVTLNGGTTTTRATQDTAAITGTAGVTAINFTGNNTFDVANSAAITAGTINASGLTGAAILDMGNTASVGVTSIIGSDNNVASGNGDVLFGQAAAATTITAGAGNDAITGGSAADSIDGGTGLDTITGGGGNDVLRGGAGNDTITVGAGAAFVDGGADDDFIATGTELGQTDTIDGGAGTDTLSITAAVTSPAIGSRVTNVEYLQTTDSSQDLSQFTATTLTRVVDEAASLELTNAASTLTTISLDATATDLLSMARLTDTSNNSVTLLATGTVGISDITLSNEETIIIDTNAAAFTIGPDAGDLLTADDLTTLTVNGDNDLIITNAIVGSTALATINNNLTAAAVFTVNATNSTSAITFTASTSTGRSTLTTGSGADVITAGLGELYATAGSGNDTITGGALNDLLSGGAGNDSLTGGAANDTLVGGTGADYINGGAGTLDYFSAEGMNASSVDGTDATSVGAVINLSSSALSQVAITSAAGGTLGISTFLLNGVASNQATYLYANTITAGSNALDTLVGIENAIGSGGADYILGSASANVLSGAAGADTINGGGGNDTITGGADNDTITLSTGATDSNTIVFADTATNNGADTIATFKAGALASGGDVFDFSATTATGVANTLSTTYTAIAAATTGVTTPVDATNKLAIVKGTVTSFDTATEIATLFGAAASLDVTGATNSIVVFAADGATAAYVWYVQSADATISSGECVLVGTVTTSTDLVDLTVAGNFLF